ncbi:hypothetical protein ACOALZ_15235 [Nocardiopsis algeriensis]|uniref:hypothetical protein n=1 Tax=Nocardiopsis algeriensis TaxID=1478215 RepID=UPI003B438A1D
MKRVQRFLSAGAALVFGAGSVFLAGAPAGAAQVPALPAAEVSVPSQDAVPGIAPRDAAGTAVYLDGAGQVMSLPGEPQEVAEAAQFLCTPVSGRDNPHRSSTGVAVSGHGWWNKGNCDNDRARVYNCLYEWYTDNTWRQKACSPKETLKPGGGSTHRTVARRNCDNTVPTSWRNHVDVDVIGEADTSEWPYRQADVNCRVF